MTLRYRYCDFALLRSTTNSAGIDVPSDLDLDDPDVIRTEGRAWLAKTWAREEAREALIAASPDLAARVDQILAGGTGTRQRDLRRAVISTASYLLRWNRRVTPFGLFAGVLPVTTGTTAPAGGTGRVVARPDADWVAEVTARLEEDRELRQRLTVVSDNTIVIRDGRVIVAQRADPGSRTPRSGRVTSIRCTGPVRLALETAVFPIEFAELAEGLGRRFPGVQHERIQSLLNGLVSQGFLLTSLHPPMTSADPLAHLISTLRAAGAAAIPAAAVLLRDLEDVRLQLCAHDTALDQETAAAIRATAAERMSRLVPASRYPLAVDVRLSEAVSIPASVLDEAARAAAVLLRLTTRPFGTMAWMEYHARFRERYGPGALVPVTELLSGSGLGYPDGYLDTRRVRPAHRMLSERDAALFALIQQASADGSGEIILTDSVLDSLVIDDQTDMVPPQRAELGVTLHASSAEAISHGDFELRVVAVPRAPTSMAGRFAYLLTGPEREKLAATYESDGAGDAMAVQLSFPPRVPHNENVVRVTPLLDHVVPIGEHPPAGTATTIAVEDLAVTADAAQMYLVHRPTGRRVVPRIPHALEMTTQTPPLARFLAQVADARTAGLGPFDPGAARVLPYLPRIRYRRTILAPARWFLSADELAASPEDWGVRLSAWRKTWRVPSRVIVCNDELRLPLDLDHALDQSLLRVQLDRAGRLELREDAPPEGNGWLGKPVELLIPLTLVDPPPRRPPVTAPPGKTHAPGASKIICVQLAGNPDRFSDLIASHLPRLAETLAPVTERWWARRYRDMIHPWSPQHVVFVARLNDQGTFAEAAARIAGFAADLEARGLPGQIALVPYREYPARYGANDAAPAAEHAFAADTLAAIAQITMADSTGIPGQALAAASMAQLAATFAETPEYGYRALITILPQGSGPIDRDARDLACRLADPADDFKALRAEPGGDAVADAWKQREAKLAEYHYALRKQRDPATVLRTLLHEHHMRAVGLDPETEKQTGRLARAAALQRLALTAGTR